MGYTFILLFALVIGSNALDCLDGAGRPTPWWSVLKLPSEHKMKIHLHYDFSSDLANFKTFNLIGKQVDEPGTSLHNTLNQLNLHDRDSIHLIAFNDHFPGEKKAKSSKAHAKGILAFHPGSQTGYFLMHSNPRYPEITPNYVNPFLKDRTYGQYYMCISLDAHGFGTMLSSLAIIQPNVYYDSAGLLSGKPPKTKHSFADLNIRLNGQKITYFSKSHLFKQEFYSTLISPHYSVNLMVESWGRPIDDPHCQGNHKVTNIKTIKFSEAIQWRTEQDHAKWAISFDGPRRVACFSDINRMSSQNNRGGGALCFDNNSNLFFALRNLIANQENCP